LSLDASLQLDFRPHALPTMAVFGARAHFLKLISIC
jgi:hypothetical protein